MSSVYDVMVINDASMAHTSATVQLQPGCFYVNDRSNHWLEYNRFFHKRRKNVQQILTLTSPENATKFKRKNIKNCVQCKDFHYFCGIFLLVFFMPEKENKPNSVETIISGRRSCLSLRVCPFCFPRLQRFKWDTKRQSPLCTDKICTDQSETLWKTYYSEASSTKFHN